MTNLFERIVKWNKDRDNMKFNHYNETKMLAEELYEFCGYPRAEAKANGVDFAEDHSMFSDEKDGRFEYNHDGVNYVYKEDVADALGDLIFIAIGGLGKLGYNPEDILLRITEANEKKGSKKDADGKIIKDIDFVEPDHSSETNKFLTGFDVRFSNSSFGVLSKLEDFCEENMLSYEIEPVYTTMSLPGQTALYQQEKTEEK